jgi:hypothetical protein
MSFGPAHALAALLLEHPDLRAARLAVDHADDLRVGHERRAGEHLAALFFEEQDLLDGDRLARRGLDAIDRDDRAWAHLHLAPARLNDCEHVPNPPQPLRGGLSAAQQRI